MPLYRYKALNARGELLDGQMEATSDAEVASRLQEQGHLPVEAKLASAAGAESVWRGLFKPQLFAGQKLVQFTQQLATLLGAGQPLDRALGILLELPEDAAAKRTITDIRDAVRGGASLSAAPQSGWASASGSALVSVLAVKGRPLPASWSYFWKRPPATKIH